MYKNRIRISWQKLLLLCFFYITNLAEGFVSSPKIITKNGNLIFESGLNRNITFRLNGKSRININDEFDLLDLLSFSKKGRNGTINNGEWNEVDDLSLQMLKSDLTLLNLHVFGPQGLDKRLRNLSNRTRTANQLLRRYQIRLQTAEAKVKMLYDRLELDNCKSSPCENGGTCLNIFNGFICKCTKYFEGSTCEKDVNECAIFAGTDLGCRTDAGQCINTFGGYSCICNPGWFGVHCTERKGDCMQSSSWELCGHGACVSSNDNFGYKCICDQGWKTNGLTPACSVDVDECSDSQTPCTTKCINLPGSFTCAPCAVGLTGNGVSCRDIDECAAQNGGCSLSPRVQCINTYGSYYCGECPLGWTGDGRACARLSTNENGISPGCSGSNICHSAATCTEISNTVICTCADGWIGSGVGIQGCIRGTANNCNNLPCLNGGTCVDAGSSYVCLCPMGFKAPNCTAIDNPCTPNPCLNSGRCRAAGGTQIICQCPPGYTGRLCESRFSRCGGMLVGSVGHLKYPEGSLYEHNAQCAWVIRTNVTQVLNVTFNAFELEDSSECRFDWLQINDGRSAASQIVGRFCGSQKPNGGNIISTTNDLYLWFRSDNSTTKEGFELEWNSIAPQCGGIIEVDSFGTISSPGSPGNYPKNRDCRWQLRAPNNKRIKLTFFSLQIEKHDSCNFDYVEITDSISDTLMEKYCNTTNPAPILLPTNEVTIHFHSDNEGGDTGFQIHYSTEERIPDCGGTFTAKEDTIKSPAFIDDSMSCEYDIKMSTSESITIEFLKFEMGEEDCIEFYDVNAEKHMNTLQSKYCGGYGSAPMILHSLYNAMQIKFHSKGGKFELKYKADCSYTFESDSDVVLSPSYPKLNNIDRWCSYKISTEPNTIISLNVVDFELKDSSLESGDCAYTFLIINDGLDQNKLGPFCGNVTPPHDLISKTNMLLLHFQSSLTSFGRGFKIEYKAIPMGKTDCGGVFTKPGYTIRLPTGDDGTYLHSMECYWVIMAPVDKGIMLNWKSFKLEPSSDCSYDFVEIYDNLANSLNDQPLARYCEMPPAIISHSRILTIKFVSDFSDASDGFEASYEFVDSTKNCGGEILSSTGRIYSPAWPANYTVNMDCIWVITTSPGTQLELQIDMFELEDTVNCTGDWLSVRNGGSTQSTLVGFFCGKSIPHLIPSFTNQLRVHFHSDGFVSARGFQIKWHVFANGCGGHLKGEEGIITSPLYPSAYPHNAQCEWLVQVRKGSSIHFTIEDLEIEELMDCNFDYLEILDGRSASDLVLSKLCRLEEGKPKQIVTTGSEALVRFRTDGSNNERGFLISYYANCRRTTTEMLGVIESPNYDYGYYKNDVNCSWTIKAPKGNHILLEFTYFDNFDNSAAVYLKDGPNATHAITEIRSFNTTGDTLVIMQNSSLVNFRLEYSMIGCIQVFHRDTGEFNSPNYPKTYPNDIECLWEIRTALGQGIELTVTDLDIEESVNCTNDALQISNHIHSSNPKERHCGKQDKIIITSSTHRMFVRFYSNALHNGKGFSASYRTLKSKCGGIINAKNGVIQSPNYPQNYPPNSDCEWTIEVAPHHSITITIEEMDMEGDYDYCEMDYLEIFEGSQDLDEGGNQLFKKCGQIHSEESVWTTKTNIAIVNFKTDDSIESKGFKLSFKENCGERIIVDEFSLGFLKVSRNGQTNDICEWQLIANDSTKHVVLTIKHSQLSPLMALEYQSESDCIEQGVKVYDGADNEAPIRSKFCKTHPPAIISNGHALTVRVQLNVTSEIEADYMTMDTYCGATYSSIMGKFSSPYYPSSYPENINCEWYIVATLGNSIVLTIESLNLEDSYECNNDYLEIRENDERGRLLGLFCGSKVPEPIVGANTLWLRFNSDDDNVGGGFLASYNYAMHNEINGTRGELQSPRYPTSFRSAEPYTWRITVDKNYVVVLSIKHIVDVDIPYIKFYDGYSDIGEQIDYANTHIVRTYINILYLTAMRGPFHFEWEQVSKESVRSNDTAKEMSEACGKAILTIATPTMFNSPGYPDGYDPSLNCSWIIQAASPVAHAILSFTKVDLEDFADCFADYLTVSASNDLQNWKQLDKLCKKDASTVKQYAGTPYLKLNFVSDGSINKTGFSSYLKTACGSELTGSRALVNITALATGVNIFQMECIWTIRVHQSRRIRITFPESYMQNPNDTGSCRTYFMVRNGVAEDSPFLGKGKYCQNEITDVLETSSNRAYIKFVRVGFPKFRAAFHYEEMSHQCSDEIVLSEESPMDRIATITTPNYPNIPNPHSECIWRVKAPAHHVIAIDFIGTFDLVTGSAPVTSACDREYVQLNDGSTELMPMIGRYCGTTKPDTKYSTSNILRIKYFTDVSEPHVGFMANVSIGRCGGTYYTSEGVINSPEKLMIRLNEHDFECRYTIEVERGSTIKFDIEKLDLPFSENCSDVTHLELHEIYSYDDTENITDILHVCGNNGKRYIVETNKIIVYYKIKGTSTEGLSFKINYETVGARCGETIKAYRGILTTPGYPGGVIRPTHCFWRIQVPKGRRVKIEFLDFDTGAPLNTSTHGRVHTFRGRLSFANDFQMQSIIARVSENPPAQIYSTDNTMGIDAFLLAFSRHRGFKLRFSSDEDSEVCRNNFDLNAGGKFEFKRPNDTDIYCSYYLQMPENETLALHVDKYEKNISDDVYSAFCGFMSPLKFDLNGQPLLPNLLCSNRTQPSVRLPFPITLKLSGNKRNKLTQLDLKYKTYKCGGIWTTYDNLTITQPHMNDDFSGVLECAWAVWPTDTVEDLEFYMDGVQFEIMLAVDFKGECEDQYLLLYNGVNQNSPKLGRYCKQASAANLVVERGLFFEYYSNSYEKQSSFNLTVKQGSGCGGKLHYPYRDIMFFDQYKNNVECIWELDTDLGFHLGLSFEGRFFIESSQDCKKDYLKVQEKNLSGEWVDLKTICGRDPPKSINSTTTEMRLIFRSDADTLGDGFTAHFERNCGGILYATGTIQLLTSPGYPNLYENNLFCNYTILPKSDSNPGILVRFVDFEVEEPPISKCMFDNVTITTRDHSGSDEETVLCGINRRHEFRGDAISIVMRTDQSFGSKGFLLKYSNNVCGGLITNTTAIESPHQHSDSNFPHSIDCFWNLTAPEGYKILIKFEELDFESHAECSYDSVEVYRGLVPVGDQRVAKFCGNLTGNIPILSVPTNTALVRSFSDSSTPSKGFKAIVSFVPNCDKEIFLDVDNSTYAFNTYTNGYANNLDCAYVFTTIKGRQLKVDFNKFHVETSDNCQDDYLEIRDGSGPFADAIGQFCGHDMPAKLMSSRNSIFLRFVSDALVNDTGFTATVSTTPLICGDHNLELKENEKVQVKSPDDGAGKYPRNINCFWRITGTKTMHLKFEKLDIEGPNSNGTCGGDYLKIYNSEDADLVEKGYGNQVVFNGHLAASNWDNFATEHIYCGSGLPDDYFSTSTKVYIKFKTDETTSKSGFSLTASAINGCFRNFTGTQGRILLSDTTDHCDIYIKAPQNYSLSLYYADVTFAEYDCGLEYLEVFDGHTNSSLQKICTYMEPGKNLFTNTNELRLRIKMNSHYTSYDMTYLASQTGPGCGGDLYNTVGILTNPYYPNNLRNNSDCRWNIRVPNNVHVLLTFDVFNLGAKSTCHSDYLQIIERNVDDTESVVRQFCGEDHPRIYKSERSLVSIRFHKTVNYDGTGWVIRFRGVYANYKIPEYYLNTDYYNGG